ncbi:MAG: mRNA splicing protein [Bathelium mastoideum]|nr:MAG: mRNA splicing protein [Bathelium mastoideum]
MAAVTSLSKALPKPQYTGDEEDIPVHAQTRGPRVIGANSTEASQIVLKRSGPPPYGQRSGWRPRAPEDFGDGGAFPEVAVAQYPLDMGRKSGTASKSNALALKVDAEGRVDYGAIARRGHGENRIVHTSFKDLIPLRQRADAGELDLARPSEEEVALTKKKTEDALAALVSGAVKAQNPKAVKGTKRDEPTYVRYTPNDQMGDTAPKQERIVKIVGRQQDPMEPPKFKHKKIPRGPPSPPPPVLHSPPRKVTAEEQAMWKIPPSISNWKNPKGYTVPLDKRLASDGRGLQDVSINDKFAQFSEALLTADRHAREEVRQRAQMQQRLAEKEKLAKEDNLRKLAQQARDDKRRYAAGGSSPDRSSRASSASRSRSRSSSPASDSEARVREEARRERRRENERQLRQSRMGTERRLQVLAREQQRDISEKVALGLAKPTASRDSMYDARLFNQTSGLAAGFNEDQPYDKPLFAAQEAINSIYRPSANADDDDGGEDAGETMERIQKGSRFEVLGRAKEGFKGAGEKEARSGPVMFEKDTGGDDPFNINGMISEATGEGGKGSKRYGVHDREEDDRKAKKARVDDDDD